MLFNLHLLRVIAALGVVYFHTTSTAGLDLDWDVGSRGVDVFFVISGFIIAYIGTRKPEQFFVRRLIRVVPFYWLATAAVFALVTVVPRYFHSASASGTHLISSLFFIPREAANGEMQPTLALGWSLNFEMFFYVLFAIALRFSQRWSPLLCVTAIVGFVAVIHGLSIGGPIAQFYARPIVLEFCFGVGVFYLFTWCSERTAAIASLPAFKWVLWAVLIGSLVAINVFEHSYPEVPRYLIAGIPATLIVSSALLLERVYGVATKNKLIVLLGEASYIVYLIHPYIIFSVLRVFVHDPQSLSTPALGALIVGLLALTSALSIAAHLWLEKPLMRSLRAVLAPDKDQRVARGPA